MAKEKNYFVFFKDIVTVAKNGIMLAADKRKLDGIAENANNYTHPKSGIAAGTYRSVKVDANGHVTEGSNPTTLAEYGITDAAKKDHTHETIGGHTVNADVPANAKFTDTTYSDATQSASGLLSAADKKKLDGIDNNAKNITVDAALSKTSANPVRNSVIAAELETLKKSAGDGKTSVAAAVTQMGVPTATDADFATIAANIKKISTGVDTTDATATAGEILYGKTAYVNEKKITGTMPNQGAKTAALNCGGSYTIPAGYHNGAGIIAANSLASQTEATLDAAAKLRNGVTAWANGTKYTGTMQEKAAQVYTPGTSDQIITAGQYLAGAQTIKGDTNLKAENIKKGVSIFGITGNVEQSSGVSFPADGIYFGDYCYKYFLNDREIVNQGSAKNFNFGVSGAANSVTCISWIPRQHTEFSSLYGYSTGSSYKQLMYFTGIDQSFGSSGLGPIILLSIRDKYTNQIYNSAWGSYNNSNFIGYGSNEVTFYFKQLSGTIPATLTACTPSVIPSRPSYPICDIFKFSGDVALEVTMSVLLPKWCRE